VYALDILKEKKAEKEEVSKWKTTTYIYVPNNELSHIRNRLHV
jgi:hypothetical protein